MASCCWTQSHTRSTLVYMPYDRAPPQPFAPTPDATIPAQNAQLSRREHRERAGIPEPRFRNRQRHAMPRFAAHQSGLWYRQRRQLEARPSQRCRNRGQHRRHRSSVGRLGTCSAHTDARNAFDAESQAAEQQYPATEAHVAHG